METLDKAKRQLLEEIRILRSQNAKLERINEYQQVQEELKNSNERFRTVLDSLDALVYVSDMDTHEILFTNKYGRDIWGDIIGKTCWKTLQSGRTGPCEFCTNDKLLDSNGKPNGVYRWEFQNTVDNQWYDCHDQAIRWTDGRLVRIEIATNITEHRQVEGELKKSEERYRRIVEDQTEFIVRWKPEGVRTFVNDSYCRYFGKTRDELIGSNFFPLIAEKDCEKVRKRMESIEPDNPVSSDEHQVILPDGSIGWNLWTDRAIFDEQGRLTEFQSVGRDITERKRAEELLRQSNNLLKESQEIARLGHYMLDVLTGSWESSDILDSIFGIGGDYHKSVDGWLQIVHRDQRDEMSAYFSEVVLGQGQPFDREYRITRVSDQQGRWVYGLGRLEFDKEGKPVRMLGTIQDITDRKQAEEAIRLSEEKFSTAFHSSPDSISITSVDDGRFLEMNEGFHEMFGYSRDEAIGKTTIELNLWQSREDRDAMLKEFEDKGKVRDLEIHICDKAGNIHDCLFSCELIMIDGEPCLVSIARDITERRRTENALRFTQFSVDHAADAAFWMRSDAKLFYVNEVACRSLG